MTLSMSQFYAIERRSSTGDKTKPSSLGISAKNINLITGKKIKLLFDHSP
jgi:hypothetical protein